ncbi:hypothetical protein [Microvirga arvi]|uniref:hypothetical protein n=1 Tax=Microvirga arvi TaxID=2778731 RepID=UPI001EF58A75|nr:hypothetical protein [Microvirga arvi]
MVDESEMDLPKRINLADQASDKSVEPFAAIETHNRDVDKRPFGWSRRGDRVSGETLRNSAASIHDSLKGCLVYRRMPDAANILQDPCASESDFLPQWARQQFVVTDPETVVTYSKANAEAFACCPPIATSKALRKPQRHR